MTIENAGTPMTLANQTRQITVGNPIVCTGTEEVSQQPLEWTVLQHRAIEVSAIEGGARMTFPAGMADVVEDLAQREGACCGFLTLVTTVEADRLTLEVTSANPDGLPVIAMLAGIPLP